MYNGNRNVTYIEDLPELEDLEYKQNIHHNNFVDRDITEKYKKFIRPKMQPPHVQSGMISDHQIYPNDSFNYQQTFSNPPPVHHTTVSQQPIPVNPNSNSPTCLDIANHVETCPICSKFYKNDRTIYIIIIVLLSIVCILLLKKVLNL
jgi:hypothetical protein